MKKSLFYIFSLTLLAFGCADKTPTTQPSTPATDSLPAAQTTPPPTAPVEGALGLNGFYVGAFEASKFHQGKNPSYSNKINISIDQMGDGKISGHSVVAGNSRPFSGTYEADGQSYKVEASEPGDDKYDGKFSFTVFPMSESLEGTWVANDSKLSVYERKYKLHRRTFAYDPNLDLPAEVAYEYLYENQDEFEWNMGGEHLSEDCIKFNPSMVKLKKEDIENMYKGDLEIMRNSIYARHGYSFKTRKMRYVFDKIVTWYTPVSTDVSKELTPLEQENIALLKRYEQHAETYYDSFGR
jgi:hypothetical protein